MAFLDVALAASGAVHDTLYGESFAIEPRAKKPGDVNGRAVEDPSRPAQTFTGVWASPNASVRPTNRTGHPSAEGAKFDDDKPAVDFEVAALPYAVAIDDVVTRIKTGLRYTVADPGDDGRTRATIRLTAAKIRT